MVPQGWWLGLVFSCEVISLSPFTLPKLLHLQFSSRWPAAAAKSLQSCPTLCDPIDGSPPGSPVPGILQARTLEWGAIAFSCVVARKVYAILISSLYVMCLFLSSFWIFFLSTKFWNFLIMYFGVSPFTFILLAIRRIFCQYAHALKFILCCLSSFWNTLDRCFTSLIDLQFSPVFFKFYLHFYCNL